MSLWIDGRLEMILMLMKDSCLLSMIVVGRLDS